MLMQSFAFFVCYLLHAIDGTQLRRLMLDDLICYAVACVLMMGNLMCAPLCPPLSHRLALGPVVCFVCVCVCVFYGGPIATESRTKSCPRAALSSSCLCVRLRVCGRYLTAPFVALSVSAIVLTRLQPRPPLPRPGSPARGSASVPPQAKLAVQLLASTVGYAARSDPCPIEFSCEFLYSPLRNLVIAINYLGTLFIDGYSSTCEFVHGARVLTPIPRSHSCVLHVVALLLGAALFNLALRLAAGLHDDAHVFELLVCKLRGEHSRSPVRRAARLPAAPASRACSPPAAMTVETQASTPRVPAIRSGADGAAARAPAASACQC